jgi:ribose transport system ATP-binding protein
MKILAGVYQPDGGTIFVDGKSVRFHHPLDAQRHGISVIHQELSLLPERTVAENIYLGREPTRFGVLDRNAMRAGAEAWLRRFDCRFGADADVRELSIAEQQIVEIAKALIFNARILVMDEPTAALGGRKPSGSLASCVSSAQRALRLSSSRTGCRKYLRSQIR